MQTGRKILNLRHDRSISQQDLARACEITPSALSKIEAGINSPRANIIWRIAKRLGVTVEYLLDENQPYPYKGHAYRQELISQKLDPDASVRMECTREERAFLEALKKCPAEFLEMALQLPETEVERVRLMHFVMNSTEIANPDPAFLRLFERLLTTGTLEGATAGEEPAGSSNGRRKTAKKTAKKAAKKSTKKKATKKRKTAR